MPSEEERYLNMTTGNFDGKIQLVQSQQYRQREEYQHVLQRLQEQGLELKQLKQQVQELTQQVQQLRQGLQQQQQQSADTNAMTIVSVSDSAGNASSASPLTESVNENLSTAPLAAAPTQTPKKCHRCGKEGHLKKQCPRKEQERQPRLAINLQVSAGAQKLYIKKGDWGHYRPY